MAVGFLTLVLNFQASINYVFDCLLITLLPLLLSPPPKHSNGPNFAFQISPYLPLDNAILLSPPMPFAEKLALTSFNLTKHNEEKPDQRTFFAPIAAVITNCTPLSTRNEIIQELMKRIPVDSYGRCMHNRDIPFELRAKYGALQGNQFSGDWEAIKRELLHPYLFTIAIENSYCPGYVTEKVYQPLAAGSIPLYLGAPDIKSHLPDPNSVIYINDYTSLDQLVEYLTQIVKSGEDSYNRFMAWKTRDPKDWNPEFFRWREHNQKAICEPFKHIEFDDEKKH